jgi:hypothetical protein
MPDQGWTDKILVAHEEYVVVRAVRESTWPAGSFRGFATPQGVTTAVEMVHIWSWPMGRSSSTGPFEITWALMRQLGVVKVGLGR